MFNASNFAKEVVGQMSVEKVDGVLIDLTVSSGMDIARGISALRREAKRELLCDLEIKSIRPRTREAMVTLQILPLQTV